MSGRKTTKMGRAEKEIVVTGMGAVTAAGLTVNDFRGALTAMRPTAEPLNTKLLPSWAHPAISRVKNFDIFDTIPQKKPSKFMGRATTLILAAAAQAITQSTPDKAGWVPERTGVVIGTSSDDFGFEQQIRIMEEARAFPAPLGRWTLDQCHREILDGLQYLRCIPNMASNFISIFHRVQGHSCTICSLVCSSVQAIGYAAAMIRRGEVDRVITGGGDAWLHPYGLMAFSQLEPFADHPDPASICKPFDSRRNGIVPGEGAACFILESKAYAEQRGAEPLAVIKGWRTAYAKKQSPGHAAACIRSALAQAAISPSKLDAAVTHGSGSPHTDATESKALAMALMREGISVPACAITPVCGHAMAGAGALQTVAAILALQHQMLFGTANWESPDPDCPATLLKKTGPLAINTLLVTNVNHDGSSSALVLGRPQ